VDHLLKNAPCLNPTSNPRNAVTQHRKGLTSIERNLLRYLATYQAKHPGQRCPIPPRVNGQTKDYVRAISYLETQGYIQLERPYAHYRTWMVTALNMPDALVVQSTVLHAFDP
jgi:hypothetical protein